MAIFGFLLLLFVDRVFAVIVLALTIAMGLLGRLFAGRLVKLKAKESEANKDFSLKMSNVFSGLEILKLNQVEDRFQDQSNVFIAALERVKIRFNIFDRFQSGTMDTLGYAYGSLLLLCRCSHCAGTTRFSSRHADRHDNAKLSFQHRSIFLTAINYWHRRASLTRLSTVIRARNRNSRRRSVILLQSLARR